MKLYEMKVTKDNDVTMHLPVDLSAALGESPGSCGVLDVAAVASVLIHGGLFSMDAVSFADKAGSTTLNRDSTYKEIVQP